MLFSAERCDELQDLQPRDVDHTLFCCILELLVVGGEVNKSYKSVITGIHANTDNRGKLGGSDNVDELTGEVFSRRSVCVYCGVGFR